MSPANQKEKLNRGDLVSGQLSSQGREEVRQKLRAVADCIVSDAPPSSVFAVGSGAGDLVEILRSRRVKAFAAPSKCADSTSVPGSIQAEEPLAEGQPHRFELVVVIDLPSSMEEVAALITELCQRSDRILFVSVHGQEAVLAGLLAAKGFYRMPGKTSEMALFAKAGDAAEAIERYEAVLCSLQAHGAELERAKQKCQKLTAQYAKLQNDYLTVKREYQRATSSISWKITKPFRAVKHLFKRLCDKNRFFRLFYKGLASLRNNGFRATLMRVKLSRLNKNDFKSYMKQHAVSQEELNCQKSVEFDRDITFSILVPLYNTPEAYLREMIQSVIDQTYAKWELCLADGSDSEHSEVERICLEYAGADNRVRYERLEQNYGISGNTNACMKMARGEFISLFDHDDILHPSALFETMRAITEQGADFVYTDEMVFEGQPDNVTLIHFKPDFSIDTLRGHNYICHFSSFSAELARKVGYFSENHNGSQDYDMVLRLCEQAKQIVHIPQVLYFWRSHPGSVASDVSVKPYCMVSAKKALADHLERIGLRGTVTDSTIPSTYKINYEIEGEPLVSILIPNKDYTADLDKCIRSIQDKSTYSRFELIIIENNSELPETFAYYDSIQKEFSNVKVVQWNGPFNFAAINNFGFSFAAGEYILMLNNDVEVLTPNWLEEMLMFAQREDVGAVGAKLYYPDDTIQHAGIIVGIGNTAGHAHKGFPRTDGGYIHRLTIAQDLSAVTGACLMTRRSVWEQLGGMDEDFVVAFNDVDFCLRIRQAGYLVVFTPYAELYHYESKSRGYDDTPEKKQRLDREATRLRSRWKDIYENGDPYYNPNLTLDREDFTLRAIGE